MRSAFIVCLLLLTSAARAAQPPGKVYQECLKAADYKGCVEVLTLGTTKASQTIEQLRTALRILPSRLASTSLQDFRANTRQFTDALAVVDEASLTDEQEVNLYKGAVRIARMIDALQSAWSTRIRSGTIYGRYGSTSYVCKLLRRGIDDFNAAAGRPAVFYKGNPAKGLFGKPLNYDECSPQEYEMSEAIISDIETLLRRTEKPKDK